MKKAVLAAVGSVIVVSSVAYASSFETDHMYSGSFCKYTGNQTVDNFFSIFDGDLVNNSSTSGHQAVCPIINDRGYQNEIQIKTLYVNVSGSTWTTGSCHIYGENASSHCVSGAATVSGSGPQQLSWVNTWFDCGSTGTAFSLICTVPANQSIYDYDVLEYNVP